MEKQGSEMENSIQEAAQVNPYLPEWGKVGNLDETQQQRLVNLAPSITVGVSLQKSLSRRQSRIKGPKAVRLQVLKTVAGADQKIESVQAALISPRRERSLSLLSTLELSRKLVVLIDVPLHREKFDQPRIEQVADPNHQYENGQVAQMLIGTNYQPSPYLKTHRWEKKTAPPTDEGLTAP